MKAISLSVEEGCDWASVSRHALCFTAPLLFWWQIIQLPKNHLSFTCMMMPRQVCSPAFFITKFFWYSHKIDGNISINGYNINEQVTLTTSFFWKSIESVPLQDRLGYGSYAFIYLSLFICRHSSPYLLFQAQNLKHAITSVEKLKGSGHTIILSCCAGTSNRGDSQIICNGFIKYGIKDLYFYLPDGKIIQSRPTCLLDFFVEESMQRNGLGLQLFQKMLQVRGFWDSDSFFWVVSCKIFTLYIV